MKRLIFIAVFTLVSTTLFSQNTFKYEIRANGGLRVGGETKIKIDSISYDGEVLIFYSDSIQVPVRNANIEIISLLSEDIIWEEGDFQEIPANVFSLETEIINLNVINQGSILGYCRSGNVWYTLPYFYILDTSYVQYICYTFSLGVITLFAYDTYGVLNPSIIDEYKFVVVTNNTSIVP